MTPEEFEAAVHEAIALVPARFRDKLENVAFVVESQARPGRRGEEPIVESGQLLGLYQGVSYGHRGPWYSGVLPDKITLFQANIEAVGHGDPVRVRRVVRDTVWHEIGHYFGMSEAEVRSWEKNRRQRRSA